MRAKKRFKRVLAMLLTVALALGNVNVTATSVQAAETQTVTLSASVDDLPLFTTTTTPTRITASNYARFNFTSSTYQAYLGYYAITSANEMYGFASLVNNVNANVNAVLINDINLATDSMLAIAYNWIPIGNTSNYYEGTFDGQGHRIYNMTVNSSAGYVGLFGYVDDGTTIRNVILDKSCSVKGESYAAGFVGACRQATTGLTIENCGNEGTVTAEWNAAGFIGCVAPNQPTGEINSNITIRNCYNTGTIDGDRESAAIAGWMGGTNTKLINCYNAGTINGADSGRSFARYNTNHAYSFTNCYQLNTVGTQAGITSFTAARAASGELCYLLNTDQSDIKWYQTLKGTLANTSPVLFEAETVYRHEITEALETGKIYYSNDSAACTHSNARQVVTEQATCIKQGRASYSCSDCGMTWTADTPLGPHDYDSETDICNVCGQEELIEPAVISASNYTNYGLSSSNYRNYLGYYAITTAKELFAFTRMVALGNTTINAIMASDIDLSEVKVSGSPREWIPIGSDSAIYAGTFDGRGHTISNLTISSEDDNIGLFGYITGGTRIRNVILDENCYIAGGNYVGGIVGAIQESAAPVTIENCGNEGVVNAASTYAGGIVGCVAPWGTADDVTLAITNCYNTGAIIAAGKSAAIGAGLGAGTTITNCYNKGMLGGADSGYTFANYAGTPAFVNCYQLRAAGTQTGITSVTASQLKSGELTYLLNGTQSTIAWYQTLAGNSTNAYPVLSGAQRVYQHEITEAIETGKIYYSNSSTACAHTHLVQTVTTASTCLKEGVVKKTCSDCEMEWTEVIPVLAHNFDSTTGICSLCNQLQVTEPERVTASNYGDFHLDSSTYAKYIGYYAITSAEEMFAFASIVNLGNTTAKAILTEDIDLSQVTVDGTARAWVPIGNDNTVYAGIFDGLNHTISNLKVELTTDKVGLFGYITGGTEIRNVILDETCSIQGGSYVGGIAGGIKPSTEAVVIENCGNEGTVTAAGSYAAAFVGYSAIDGDRNEANLTITNCYNTGKITASSYAAAIGAGLGAKTTITNCYNIGTVSGGRKGYEFANYSSIGTTVNSYQLNTVGTPNTNTKLNIITKAQVESGELCYRLNGEQTDIKWYQTIRTESSNAYPMLSGTQRVYQHLSAETGKNYYLNSSVACTHPNMEQYVASEATCAIDGTIKCSCDGCDQEWTVAIPANGHQFDTVPGKCSICDVEKETEPNVLDATNYLRYGFHPDTYEKYLGYYVITNAKEMFAFSNLVYCGNTTARAVLTEDIDFSEENGREWIPIGYDYAAYAGIFDGQGHTISNLKINSSEDKVGLFGYINGGAAIRNVILAASCEIVGKRYVGGIAGALKKSSEPAVIENCGNEGSVYAKVSYAAAILAYVAPESTTNSDVVLTITNCYNKGAIEAKNYAAAIGARLSSSTTIANSYNIGTVTGGNTGFEFANYAGVGVIENSYQLYADGKIPDAKLTVSAITSAQAESGELCYRLNGKQDTITWYQSLDDGETYPKLFGTVQVYQHKILGDDKYYYTNDADGCQHQNKVRGEVVKADCVTAGTTAYSCDICGSEWRETNQEAYGHYYTDDTHECIRCGRVQAFDGISTRPATVTEENYTEYGLSASEYKGYIGFYAVTTPAELFGYAKIVNGTDPAASAILVNDIVINQELIDEDGNVDQDEDIIKWEMLGDDSRKFAGTIDGRDHAISGLYLNEANQASLIAYANDCTVRNLGITDSYMKGNTVASFVTYFYHGITIENCYSTAILDGTKCYGIIGGLYTQQASITVSQAAFFGEIADSATTSIPITDSFQEYGAIVENCVYLRDEEDETSYWYGQGYTADECASGAAAYALNNGETEQISWYQNIGTDAFPVLDAAHATVYSTTSCQMGYANEANVEKEHHFVEHVCEACGMTEDVIPDAEDGYYEISTAEQFLSFANMVNTGNTSVNARLMADIDLDEVNWTPIGTSEHPYKGTFDGQSYRIKNFKLTVDGPYQALFGAVEAGTHIQRVVLDSSCEITVSSNIQNESMVAALVSRSVGKRGEIIIEQCVNEAAVTSTVYGIQVSAFFARNEASNYSNKTSCLRIIIRNCHNAGKLTGTTVMIMAGDTKAYPIYENCLSTGVISGSRIFFAASSSNIRVENCYVLNDGAIWSNVVATQCKTEEMQSGKIAYQLNAGAGEDIFYQNLGTDDVPTMDASHASVYAEGTVSCDGDIKELSFNNVGPSEIVADTHDFADGKPCSVCGECKEPQCIDGIYQISDYSELLWFADMANECAKEGIIAAKRLSAVLTDNIVANENLLDDSGNLAAREAALLKWSKISDFWGTLDGQGHTISGLYLSETYAAFCNNLYGTLKNIGIIDSYFKASSYAATFTVYVQGEMAVIKNCYSTATVDGYREGGIANQHYRGVVENCYYAGNGTSQLFAYRGNGILSNCYYLTTDINDVADNEQDGEEDGYAALASDFASGKVAYQMNENAGTNVWYQKLGDEGDPMPGLLAASDNIVYAAGDMSCDGTLLTENYVNVPSDITVQSHTLNEKGICEVCHQGQQPEMINGVYQIGIYGELVWFAEQVNAGQVELKGELTADIIANDNLLNSDGSPSTTTPAYTWEMMTKFYGTLDGKGHTISGLYLVDDGTYIFAGLCYELGGTLQNIGIVDSYFAGAGATTFAVMDASGDAKISNCYSMATISAPMASAGIVLLWGNTNSPEVENCYYAGVLQTEGMHGIAYFQEGNNIKNCYYIDTYYNEADEQAGTPMSAADFASGKVAYLLNESQSAGTTWYQKISDASDVYPHMTASNDSLVYTEYAHGSNEIKGYSNTAAEGHTEPCTAGTHDIYISDNGECEICGAQVAVIIRADDIAVNHGYDEAIELKPEITKAAAVEITEARWYEVVKTKNGDALNPLTAEGAVVESLMVDASDKSIGEYEYVLIVKTSASESEIRKTITVVVGKAFLDASVFSYTPPTDLSYNGEVKTAAVGWAEVLTGAGELTVKYRKDNRGVFLDEVSEAGTYYVYAVVTGTDTYIASEIEVGSFTINYIDAPTNILYNGAAKAVSYVTGTNVVVSANGYTVSDSLTGTFADNYTLTSASAGTVTKTLYFKNSAGYTCKSVDVSAAFIEQTSTTPITPVVPTPDPTPITPTPTPTPAPVTPVQTLPKKNAVVTVGKAVYKVTVSSKTKGTVTFMKPTNKTQKSITVPNTVKINGYTFKVTAIAANACKANSKLTTVSIGTNVKTIGKNAFLNCKKLSNITIKTTKLTSKTIGKNAFKGIKSTATIKVPSSKLKAYTKLLRTKGVTKKSKIKK